MRVVVIGAGLIGLSSAYHLNRLGATVTVIDRAEAPARETSFANGSLLTPSLADPWNSPGVLGALLRSLGREDSAMLLRLKALPSLALWGLRYLRQSSRSHFERSFLSNVRFARYSQDVMRDLLQRQPLAFDYAPDGTVKVFRDQAALDAGIRVANWLKQAEIAHRPLNREALLALEPALGNVIDQLAGGIHYPQDEVGDARRFCEALKAVTEAAGVQFRFSDQVLDVQRHGNSVLSLTTPRGRLEADQFVLAAGSYSWPLGGRFGVRVPVRPAKGYSLTVPVADVQLRPRYAIVDDHLHAAVVPLGDDRLRIAGTAEFTGFDSSLPDARLNNLGRLLGQIYPQVDVQDRRVEQWCGFRPMTPDGMPIIGRTPITNLFLNTGHGPLGWTMACGSGKLLADLMTGNPTDVDAAAFALSRF